MGGLRGGGAQDARSWGQGCVRAVSVYLLCVGGQLRRLGDRPAFGSAPGGRDRPGLRGKVGRGQPLGMLVSEGEQSHVLGV